MKALPADPIAYIGESTPKSEDDSPAEVVTKAVVERPGEGFGNAPLEDRHGRSLWVKTRLCFCPLTAPTDCRFHSPAEKGWEQCPYLEKAKTDNNVLGKWLWAKNSLYGKPLTEDEVKERAVIAEKVAA